MSIWVEDVMDNLCHINPAKIILNNDTEVSFLGMADVSNSARIINNHIVKYQAVKSGFTSFKDGDVLVAKITPCFENGKGARTTNLKNGVGFGSTEFHVLRAKEGISPILIYYHTISGTFRKNGKSKMTGSAGQQRVPKSFIASYKIKFPTNIKEQNIIGDVLIKIDQAIEKTEKLIAKYGRIKTGLMQDLLMRGIDEEGNIRDKETHEFRKTSIGYVPAEWRVLPLGDCCEQHISYGINAAAVQFTNELPVYLRITDIDEDGNFIEEGKMSVNDAKWTSYLLKRDDVVLARTGNTTGKSFYCDGQIPNLVYAGFLVKASTNKEVLLGEYLFYYTLSSVFKKWVQVMSTRSGQPGISGKEYESLLIPVPSVNEQWKVIEKMRSISWLLDKELENVSKLLRLKSGLMQDLLTGRVRVDTLINKIDMSYAFL